MAHQYNEMEHHSSVVMNSDHQIQTRLTKHQDTKPCLQMLGHVLTTARVAGLYYEPVGRPCRLNISFCYCVLLLLVTFFEFVRVFFIYDSTDGFNTKMLKVLMHAFFMQMMLGNVIFLFRVTPRIRNYFKEYDMYRAHADVINNDERVLRGVRHKVLVFWFLSGPLKLIFTLLTVIYPSTAYNYLRPYYQGPPENISYAAASIFAICRLFHSFNDITNVVFLLSTCHLLIEEFDLTTSQLEKYSREEHLEDEGAQTFNSIRQHYLRLCKLATTLDGAVGPYVLAACLTDLLGVTFHVLPLMLNKPIIPGQDTLSVMVVVASGLDRVFHLGGVVYAGVSLTAKTRKIQPLLMRLDVSAMCRSSYQVAQLFLLKVAYDHVGLTAWGLLNINKPFVVTVVSLGLTYSVILGRFGLTLGDKTPAQELFTQVINYTTITANATILQ